MRIDDDVLQGGEPILSPSLVVIEYKYADIAAVIVYAVNVDGKRVGGGLCRRRWRRL